MSINTFESSQVVFGWKEQLQTFLSSKQRQDLVRTIDAMYMFNVRERDGNVETWLLDCKTGPDVILSPIKKSWTGSNIVDVTVEIRDFDFKDLLQRKVSGQDLFIMGQITTKEREGLGYLMRLDALLKSLAKATSGKGAGLGKPKL
ncbi:hypothetical protein EMPS_08439 [Entomortierella parvispora]|uniref:SCP2 domain-containing protein n=1 Tax=Entomortierella parvispora TaxID=205924 RepID=A0A9P3HG06_9FUNG|nr:hypothetical protein EMPS_08439 [Entomortierella parvispora]